MVPNNQFMQYFQMYLQQQGMTGMNPMMVGNQMNQMTGMNPMMVGNQMNQMMMGMNPGMSGGGNVNINYIRNMLVSMGYNEMLVNNFLNMLLQNNQQSQQNQPNIRNSPMKNLVFQNKNEFKSYIIQVTDNETMGSVINKYINKSGDSNINLYIYNGKKINESLNVAEAGLIDNAPIDVVSTNELEGAFIK